MPRVQVNAQVSAIAIPRAFGPRKQRVRHFAAGDVGDAALPGTESAMALVPGRMA